MNVTRITGPLHEDVCTFIVISRWIILRLRNFANKSCTENKNTLFLFSNFKLYSLWDNVQKYVRAGQTTDGSIIRRMRLARWINKATDTHSEYVILNAFPRRQWLCERAWMVRYTYLHFLPCSVLMDMFQSVSYPFAVIMAINNLPGANQMFYCSSEKENSS